MDNLQLFFFGCMLILISSLFLNLVCLIIGIVIGLGLAHVVYQLINWEPFIKIEPKPWIILERHRNYH
jgi:hypothetical protein